MACNSLSDSQQLQAHAHVRAREQASNCGCEVMPGVTTTLHGSHIHEAANFMSASVDPDNVIRDEHLHTGCRCMVASHT